LSTHTYTVNGMTCDHCRQAVTTELMALDGVQAVDVDLAGGQVRVTAVPQPTRDLIVGAVCEAGYELGES
jgi:copper chaperone CopZ